MENFVEYSLRYRLTAVDHIKRMVFSLLPMVAGVLLIMLWDVLSFLLYLHVL